MLHIADLIARNNLTLRVTKTDHNPNMDDADKMDHWRCTLRNGLSGNRVQITFSMGSGHNGRRPEIADILDCMASDASGFENARSFEEWCAEYGYDTDSRKAEKIFRAIRLESEKLKCLMGHDYSALLWETERL